MERLTSWNEDCVLINGHALWYATKCELVQMAERLAAYEDSRLSPQACAQAAEIEKQLASYDFSAKKMLEFIRADKDGRCVVLPCTGYSSVDIARDGVSYRPDHWNIYLTAHAHGQNTPSGLKEGLFDIGEVERALQEMEGKKDGV